MSEGNQRQGACEEQSYYSEPYTRIFSEHHSSKVCRLSELEQCFNTSENVSLSHSRVLPPHDCGGLITKNFGVSGNDLASHPEDPSKLANVDARRFDVAQSVLQKFDAVLITELLSHPGIVPWLLRKLGVSDTDPDHFFGCSDVKIRDASKLCVRGSNRAAARVGDQRISFNLGIKKFNGRNPHNESALPSSPEVLKDLASDFYWDSRLYCDARARLESDLRRQQGSGFGDSAQGTTPGGTSGVEEKTRVFSEFTHSCHFERPLLAKGE